MKIKALIFDLDGTLLNTIDDLADSMNKVLNENKFPFHEVEKYYYFVGDGARKLVERALPEGHQDDDSINKALQRYREIYHENWNKKTKPYRGIDKMLYRLKTLEFPMSVLSNKPHSDLLKCVNNFFEPFTFFSVTGQKDFVPQKPAPDGALTIAEELKIPAGSFIFMGDSSVDMKTAKAAGMVAVGVTWGFRGKKELLENGADYIIDDPSGLLSLL